MEIVHCIPIQAHIVFRIYCKSNLYTSFFLQTVKLMCLHTIIGSPDLWKNLIVRVQGDDVNIQVDLH